MRQTASRSRVAVSYLLAVLLFVLTLGVGYVIWSLVTWGQGQTPAQRLCGLRCWHPQTGQVASRGQMAMRQITGLALNGELLAGLFILMCSDTLSSVGDIFADTMVLREQDHPLEEPAQLVAVNRS